MSIDRNLALDRCDDYDRDTLDRIGDRIDVVGACWVWRGMHTLSTPQISYRNKKTSVRGVVYRLTVDYDDYRRVTTSCKTPFCVRPDHLEIWDSTHVLAPKPRKLTMDQRAEIIGTPNIFGSGVALAKRYGVSPSLISAVRNQVKGNRRGRVS